MTAHSQPTDPQSADAPPVLGKQSRRPLKNITREMLEPIWKNLDINTRVVAERLGVTRAALSYRAVVKFGLPPRPPNPRLTRRSDPKLFAEMWEAGVSSREIAEYFGYANSGCISPTRKALGLPKRTRAPGSGGRSGWPRPLPLKTFLDQRAEAALGRLMKETR
jgi:hypothetical protein